MANFSITTTLPYVNAEPHIGFAKEIVEADALARFHRLLGEKVVFNTGTDEHGLKIFRKAQEAGVTPQAYCDEYAAKFSDLRNLLNLSYTHFIRTTDEHHIKAAQEFWERCENNGDIYKKSYTVKYCVGCELEKTESELVEGRCPLHPNQEVELIDEENYFFRFSRYQQPLLDLYAQNPQFVRPASRMSEITSFVSHGLQDFSISRLKTKMPWGVPVPGDEAHVMYVWFDALVNYISTLGWPDVSEQGEFAQFWPSVQVAGKDNLRQQSAMWQAMLLSAGVAPSRCILIEGFISVAGQKMSKSLGNVIAPGDLVSRYGQEGTRFLLLSLGSYGEDIDVTWDRFDTLYTAHLANGLGNLASRVAKLASMEEKTSQPTSDPGENFQKTSGKLLLEVDSNELDATYLDLLQNFRISDALALVMNWVAEADKVLSTTKPWTLSGEERTQAIQPLVETVWKIALHLQPFLPETAEQLLQHFGQEQIEPLTPLFPRLVPRT